jgi:O-antigen ligase
MRGLGAAAAGVATGAFVAVTLPRVGPAAAALPAAAAIGAWLLLRPDVALLVLLASVVLVEGDTQGILGSEERFYGSVIGGLTVLDFLVLVLVTGVALEWFRGREPSTGIGQQGSATGGPSSVWREDSAGAGPEAASLGGPSRMARSFGLGPLGWALGLLAVALAGGLLTGYAAGIGMEALVPAAVKIGHLIVLPFATAALLRRRPALLRDVLVLAAALVAVKSAAGLLLAVTGGQPVVEGQAATYLEPSTNWLVMTALLVGLAAVLERSPEGRRHLWTGLPWWALALAPLAAAGLLFSYRRSFWIAAVVGAAVVLVVASRRARPFLALAAVALGLALYVALSGAGGTAGQSSPIVERASSLRPSRLSANAEDRYRLDERRNVMAEIRRHPVAGLGLEVPWRARHPLPLEHEGGRTYAHVAILYYWLKMGLLGLAAYVAVVATSLLLAWRVWRRAAAPLHRAVGLGLLASLAGLAVAETTASFTGVDYRFSLLHPLALGVLAAISARTSARSTTPVPTRSAG